MDKSVRKRIEVDTCPKCEGMWLDTRELLKLTDNKTLHEFLFRYAQLEGDSQLVCPRCGGLMNAEMAQGTEVDICTTCRGVWLDAGELEQVSGHDEVLTEDLSKELELQANRKKRSLLDKLVEWRHYK